MGINQVSMKNADSALSEVLWKLRGQQYHVNTRNGKAVRFKEPFYLTLTSPRDRIVWSPLRNANPFFHIMEFVWMVAGSNDANWISIFNSRMKEYSNGNTLHGAYGYRWTIGDQLESVVRRLTNNPDSRQAVVAMWHPELDTEEGLNDYPCNTHIYFELAEGKLNMTVCNRSNDLIWGMLGSNVVHFTMLQELIAHAVEAELGEYRVFTNNLHVYEPFWEWLNDPYKLGAHPEQPMGSLLHKDESWRDFVQDCRVLVSGSKGLFRTHWMNQVGLPLYQTYRCFKEEKPRNPELLRGYTLRIRDATVRQAAMQWMGRAVPDFKLVWGN